MATPQQVFTPLPNQSAQGSSASTQNIYAKPAPSGAFGMDAATLQALSGLGDAFIGYQKEATKIELEKAVLRAKVDATQSVIVPKDEPYQDNRFYQQAFLAQSAQVEGAKAGQELLKEGQKQIPLIMEKWDNSKENSNKIVTDLYTERISGEQKKILGELAQKGGNPDIYSHPVFQEQINGAKRQLDGKFLTATQTAATNQRLLNYKGIASTKVKGLNNVKNLQDLFKNDKASGLPIQHRMSIMAEVMTEKIRALTAPRTMGNYSSEDMDKADKLLKLLNHKKFGSSGNRSLAQEGGSTPEVLAGLQQELVQYESNLRNDGLQQLGIERREATNKISQDIYGGTYDGISFEEIQRVLASHNLSSDQNMSLTASWRTRQKTIQDAAYIQNRSTEPVTDIASAAKNVASLERLATQFPESSQAKIDLIKAQNEYRKFQTLNQTKSLVQIRNLVQNASTSEELDAAQSSLNNFSTKDERQRQEVEQINEQILKSRDAIKLAEDAQNTSYTTAIEKIGTAIGYEKKVFQKVIEIAKAKTARTVNEVKATQGQLVTRTKSVISLLGTKYNAKKAEGAIDSLNIAIDYFNRLKKGLTNEGKTQIQGFIDPLTEQRSTLHNMQSTVDQKKQLEGLSDKLTQIAATKNTKEKAQQFEQLSLIGAEGYADSLRPLIRQYNETYKTLGRSINGDKTRANLLGLPPNELYSELENYLDPNGVIDQARFSALHDGLRSNESNQLTSAMKTAQALFLNRKVVHIKRLEQILKDGEISKEEIPLINEQIAEAKKISEMYNPEAQRIREQRYNTAMTKIQTLIVEQTLKATTEFQIQGMFITDKQVGEYRAMLEQVSQIHPDYQKLHANFISIQKQRKDARRNFDWEGIATDFFNKNVLPLLEADKQYAGDAKALGIQAKEDFLRKVGRRLYDYDLLHKGATPTEAEFRKELRRMNEHRISEDADVGTNVKRVFLSLTPTEGQVSQGLNKVYSVVQKAAKEAKDFFNTANTPNLNDPPIGAGGTPNWIKPSVDQGTGGTPEPLNYIDPPDYEKFPDLHDITATNSAF